MLDQETTQALEAAAERADAMAGAIKTRKPKTINHTARCKKTWEAFQAAAFDALENGVNVKIRLRTDAYCLDGDEKPSEPTADADLASISITAVY